MQERSVFIGVKCSTEVKAREWTQVNKRRSPVWQITWPSEQ